MSVKKFRVVKGPIALQGFYVLYDQKYEIVWNEDTKYQQRTDPERSRGMTQYREPMLYGQSMK